MYAQCIKSATEAITFMADSPKGYYRIALAQKELKEYDSAKENFEKAIKLAPRDKGLREEYEAFCNFKRAKEQKQWQQMAGFYNTKKLDEIEMKEEQD